MAAPWDMSTIVPQMRHFDGAPAPRDWRRRSRKSLTRRGDAREIARTGTIAVVDGNNNVERRFESLIPALERLHYGLALIYVKSNSVVLFQPLTQLARRKIAPLTRFISMVYALACRLACYLSITYIGV